MYRSAGQTDAGNPIRNVWKASDKPVRRLNRGSGSISRLRRKQTHSWIR